MSISVKTVKIPRLAHQQEHQRQFKVIGSLRWEMTDHYGYPVELNQIRNDRIDSVLSNVQSDDVLESVRYSLALVKRDGSGWCHYNIDLYGGKLNLYSTVDDESTSHLRIKLNCSDFVTAESLVKLLCQSNNMELMPVSRCDFKSR